MAGSSRTARRRLCDKYPNGSLERYVPPCTLVCRLFTRYTFHGRSARYLLSGETSAAACARANNYARGFLGRVSPISSEAQRDASDGERPTDSEPAASGGERPNPYLAPATASHSCLKQASDTPLHIAYIWIRGRWRRKLRLPPPSGLRTTKGRGDRGRGRKGFLDLRPSGCEEPDLTFGTISGPFSLTFGTIFVMGV